jgi:hypothetical protein
MMRLMGRRLAWMREVVIIVVRLGMSSFGLLEGDVRRLDGKGVWEYLWWDR